MAHYGQSRGRVGLTLGFLGLFLGAGYFLIDLQVIPLTVPEGMLLVFFAAFTVVLSLVLIGHGLQRQ
jgi:hypothetical protein